MNMIYKLLIRSTDDDIEPLQWQIICRTIEFVDNMCFLCKNYSNKLI